MAATKEKRIKDKIVKVLKDYGAYYFYPVTGGFGGSGVPDIIVCYEGTFVGIEVKYDAKRRGPTELQKRNLQRIHEAGGVALVLDKDNWELITAILDGLAAYEGIVHGMSNYEGYL